jgi:hypothetical protein
MYGQSRYMDSETLSTDTRRYATATARSMVFIATLAAGCGVADSHRATPTAKENMSSFDPFAECRAPESRGQLEWDLPKPLNGPGAWLVHLRHVPAMGSPALPVAILVVTRNWTRAAHALYPALREATRDPAEPPPTQDRSIKGVVGVAVHGDTVTVTRGRDRKEWKPCDLAATWASDAPLEYDWKRIVTLRAGCLSHWISLEFEAPNDGQWYRGQTARGTTVHFFVHDWGMEVQHLGTATEFFMNGQESLVLHRNGYLDPSASENVVEPADGGLLRENDYCRAAEALQ